MHWRGRGDSDRGRAPLTTAAADRAALVAALNRVSSGDKAALREVYARTSAKLYGVALRIFGNEEDARDLLQDVYVTVWQRAGSFNSARASPITWLVTMTRNRAIDRLRSRATRVTVPLDLTDDPTDERPDAEAQLLARDDDRRVEQCLEQLRAGDQTLVRTAFFDGQTYAELAARANMPLGTIKSRIRRALLQLRGCLA